MVKNEDYRISRIELFFLDENGEVDTINSLDNEAFEEDEQGRLLYDGNPFTGVEYNYWTNGQKASESYFVDGLMEGLDLGWYPDGSKWREFYYQNNLVTSFSSWFDNGKLKDQGKIEFGYTIWKKEWDEEGNFTNDFKINPESKEYQQLVHLRQIKEKKNDIVQ